jgi:hypothetical protein
MVSPPPNAASNPSSPIQAHSTHSRKSSTTQHPTDTIPLNDPQRTHPVHASLPALPLLPPNTQHTNINPLTLQPFTPAELTALNYDKLRAEFLASSSSAEPNSVVDKAKIHKAQEEAVARLQERMKERDKKTEEIEKMIAEMEKTREIEKRVWEKRMRKD